MLELKIRSDSSFTSELVSNDTIEKGRYKKKPLFKNIQAQRL